MARAPHRTVRLRIPGSAAFAALAAATLAGCAGYVRPSYPLARTWATAPPGTGAQATAVAQWPTADWWRGFDSVQLDRYIAEAEAHNDDIAAAVARVEQADAEARIAGAALLPSVSGQFLRSRQKSFSPFSGSAGALHTEYSPTLTASYVLDFFGRNRALRRAAVANAQASRFDRETVDLTVVSSVALTYFQALALRDRLQVAQDNLTHARTILDALQLEARVGTATALDVAQQAATVAALEAAVPPLQQQLREADDALAVLIGHAPEEVAVTAGTLGQIKQPLVRPGLPSELLARRPDVAAAEASLRAAHANIEAARAALFPNVSLTANGGFASPALSGLIAPEHKVYGLTATLLQPIFEGGAARGGYQLEKSRYAELLADYHKTVLTALSNVEDALISLQQTAEQQRREQNAVDTARRAFDFAQMQLQAGVTNVLTVLNTESALFTAEDALIQVQFAHLQALVNLYRALGGGWTDAAPDATDTATADSAVPAAGAGAPVASDANTHAAAVVRGAVRS